jgi:hypothetical protein
MADKAPKDMTRDELLGAPRLHPAPRRAPDGEAPIYSLPAGQITVEQYLALRQVPEHRRAARRAFVGDRRVATVAEFDRLFAGARGPAREAG